MHPSQSETDMIGHLMSLSTSGDIWVAGRCGEVVRITRGHHIEHIRLPEFHDCPNAIVPGFDDDAWFVEYAPVIGHVFADGRVNFYQVPGPRPGALNIALDRSGHVWFSDAFNDAYGELTPQDDSGRLSPPP
jgi:streptogramin lyase